MQTVVGCRALLLLCASSRRQHIDKHFPHHTWSFSQKTATLTGNFDPEEHTQRQVCLMQQILSFNIVLNWNMSSLFSSSSFCFWSFVFLFFAKHIFVGHLFRNMHPSIFTLFHAPLHHYRFTRHFLYGNWSWAGSNSWHTKYLNC